MDQVFIGENSNQSGRTGLPFSPILATQIAKVTIELLQCILQNEFDSLR